MVVRDALNAIKSARASRDFGISANWYIAKDERLYASDGRMSASALCSTGLDRMIPGDELEKLVGRLDDEVVVTAGQNEVTISAGRMRGTIATQGTEATTLVAPDQAWTPPPDGLTRAMALARPFVADVAAQPYATCLCLRDGQILATTNIALIQVDCPGLVTGCDLLVPSWAVDFVIKVQTPLEGVIFTPSYAAFQWPGLWFRCQLVTGAFPASVGALLGQVAPEQPLALTNAWRRAYGAVAGISEGVITLESRCIIGGHGRSRVEHDIDPIDLPEPVRFDPKFLGAVVDCASAWNPAAFPAPVPFVGNGCKGLIVGRRQ